MVHLQQNRRLPTVTCTTTTRRQSLLARTLLLLAESPPHRDRGWCWDPGDRKQLVTHNPCCRVHPSQGATRGRQESQFFGLLHIQSFPRLAQTQGPIEKQRYFYFTSYLFLFRKSSRLQGTSHNCISQTTPTNPSRALQRSIHILKPTNPRRPSPTSQYLSRKSIRLIQYIPTTPDKHIPVVRSPTLPTYPVTQPSRNNRRIRPDFHNPRMRLYAFPLLL